MTEESLSGDTWLEEIKLFTQGLPRRLWPNMYVDVNNTFITWLKQTDAGLVMNANVMDATHLGATKNGEDGFIEPLIEFAQEILSFLRVASLIDFSPAAYMYARSSGVTFGPIDWEANSSQDDVIEPLMLSDRLTLWARECAMWTLSIERKGVNACQDA